MCSVETVMLVGASEPRKGITFHPDQINQLGDAVPIVDMGRICLAIGTQNRAEISICDVQTFLCIGYF